MAQDNPALTYAHRITDMTVTVGGENRGEVTATCRPALGEGGDGAKVYGRYCLETATEWAEL